jgi:hypothetical protein
MEWTSEDGKDYQDLEDLYKQVLAQYNRYMGHVTANIGGVVETYKTYDQEGAVYEPVIAEKQKRAMKFLQENLFKTPEWLLDNNISNRIEFDGSVERISDYQTRTLNNLLDFGRMARLIENEELHGDKAYGLLSMMTDLRTGIFSEVNSRKDINLYRRNLQRAYLERMEYLMTNQQKEIPARYRRYVTRSNINVKRSDISAVVRAELEELQQSLRNAQNRFPDKMSRIHAKDLVERIELILNPED